MKAIVLLLLVVHHLHLLLVVATVESLGGGWTHLVILKLHIALWILELLNLLNLLLHESFIIHRIGVLGMN
jgi:hypothetical protein